MVGRVHPTRLKQGRFSRQPTCFNVMTHTPYELGVAPDPLRLWVNLDVERLNAILTPKIIDINQTTMRYIVPIINIKTFSNAKSMIYNN